MKQGWIYIIGLMFLGMITFDGGTAMAGSKNGPYYAMPSWDQTLPASDRFIVLTSMNDEAVLDQETGLVWEQSPSTSTFNWETAQFHCNQLTTGGRLGWRLPTIQELASLVDPSVAPPGPTLPNGHPFSNVQQSFYWSATTSAGFANYAWFVKFNSGLVNLDIHFDKSFSFAVWCVRGGQGVDPQ
jgi:hypothetical protein